MKKNENEFLKDDLRVFVVPVDIMEIPDLDIYEQMVYIVLRSFVNPHKAEAFPSYNTIAKLGRMSRRKAIDVIQSLLEKGLIQKESRFQVKDRKIIRQTSNLYTLKRPPQAEKTEGGAQRAPGVVHSVHRGGAQRAPQEYNHLNKDDDDNYIKGEAKNSFQEAFREEAKNQQMPVEEIEAISESIEKENIQFNLIVLQKTIELVMNEYKNTNKAISSFKSYFLSALKNNQKRYNHVQQLQEKEAKTAKAPVEFVFYNWLEEPIL